MSPFTLPQGGSRWCPPVISCFINHSIDISPINPSYWMLTKDSLNNSQLHAQEIETFGELRLSEQTITRVQAILQFWMGIQPAKTMQQIVILVGGLEHDFFSISYMGCHPSQFICFKMVETTNQGNYEYCKENIIVVSLAVYYFFTLRWLFCGMSCVIEYRDCQPW